ncbi:pyruvate synthase subunit PorD [Desulfovibrio sulfodismutans]|uniref:Pyruvate synthase subunit PorD n=1 Tax=Desulfolutivibrio sulfodismutans TaxID=63561 RepID=A0A7K3NLT3_9BACT|nr:4Fe-4S binding protein [Desulfolutivibrio sulfodismutans]NDY56735.1 pyruvate synthase subunit PorD [Desulfolutivibrio sulfodismutans]QLA14005.1 pyruvate synthase subunit PorD [Desulfolutivibrio sulfodismutans DSM 3696]
MSKQAIMAWEDLALGAAILKPGNAKELRTGDWRSMKPKLDEEKCIKCALCAMYCPEFCISVNAEGFYHPDFYFCKGCGVCANECPKEAITMVKEGE